MTPARRRETYQPKRDRREVVVAVLAVAAIVLATAILLVLFKPDDGNDTVPSAPTITLPTDTSLPTDTNLPTDTTVATTPATEVPAP
jgi:hypothetical protein